MRVSLAFRSIRSTGLRASRLRLGHVAKSDTVASVKKGDPLKRPAGDTPANLKSKELRGEQLQLRANSSSGPTS